jgi:hypothetical protein
MTEPVKVSAPKLLMNAAVFGAKMGAEIGNVRVRVVTDVEVLEGFTFESCNGLVRDDQTAFEVTWGPDRENLGRFVGKQVRLHIQADAPCNLYSYRFGN